MICGQVVRDKEKAIIKKDTNLVDLLIACCGYYGYIMYNYCVKLILVQHKATWSCGRLSTTIGVCLSLSIPFNALYFIQPAQQPTTMKMIRLK